MIDAHQHFWCIERADCCWPTPDLNAIYRDFLPEDYETEIEGLSIAGSVLVQSQACDSDTDFLLALAENTPKVKAVVAWADLSSAGFERRLFDLKKWSKFRGLRPMLQSIEQSDWILSPSLDCAIQLLAENDVRFDALIQPRHLNAMRVLVKRFPKLQLVIDHGAKPNIAQKEFDLWATGIRALAEHPNVYCKLSGLVTEAESSQWLSLDGFSPYITHLLECFGSSRLMWGSDWPVVNIATGLKPWAILVEQELKSFCDRKKYGDEKYIIERNSIFSGTASYFYKI